MAVQYSVTVRNAMLDIIETTIGASARLIFYTGAAPANCAAAATGTVLATIVCPADWMAAASAGSKVLQGSWTITASGTGTVGYYRMYDSTVTTCHEQGTVGLSGSDINVDNTSVNTGQTVTITSKTITAGNA